MAPTRQLPRTLKVGTFIYKVDVSPTKKDWLANRAELERDGAVAFCDVRMHQIMVDPDIAVDLKKESLLHEMLHACFAAGGQPDLDDAHNNEEQFIQVTAHWLLMVLRDNPEWTQWLLEDK